VKTKEENRIVNIKYSGCHFATL